MALELPELREIDLGGPVRYREWGGPPGTTFVLVHGLGGSQLSWALVAPELAGLGRVVALDLPGFGVTPKAGRSAALMDQRRMLSRFLDELVPGRRVLSGHSMGGTIAVLQVAVEPGSASALVLTSPALPVVRRVMPHPAIVAAFALYDTPGAGERLARVRFRAARRERVVRAGLAVIASGAGSVPDELVRALVQENRKLQGDPDAPVAFLEATRSILRLGRHPQAAWRAIEAVGCPTLVVHGRLDRYVPAAWSEAVLARRKDWRYRSFPDVGHLPMMEAPGRWLSAVADWYAESVD